MLRWQTVTGSRRRGFRNVVKPQLYRTWGIEDAKRARGK
jgi:hypothetical protein